MLVCFCICVIFYKMWSVPAGIVGISFHAGCLAWNTWNSIRLIVLCWKEYCISGSHPLWLQRVENWWWHSRFYATMSEISINPQPLQKEIHYFKAFKLWQNNASIAFRLFMSLCRKIKCNIETKDNVMHKNSQQNILQILIYTLRNVCNNAVRITSKNDFTIFLTK